jgi:hypothetical protein
MYSSLIGFSGKHAINNILKSREIPGRNNQIRKSFCSHLRSFSLSSLLVFNIPTLSVALMQFKGICLKNVCINNNVRSSNRKLTSLK